MKNSTFLSWSFMTFILFAISVSHFVNCTTFDSKEEIVQSYAQPQFEDSLLHVFSGLQDVSTKTSFDVCHVKTLPSNKKAISQKGKYWKNGQTVYIGLGEPTDLQRYLVEKVVDEIKEFVNLDFQFTKPLADSDIRIGFLNGAGSWSYIGTDALKVKDDFTMNLGWIPKSGTFTQSDIGTIRHEILHAIGALHEHQNPKGGIKWKEKVVINDLSGAPNYWSVPQIWHNVLGAKNPATINNTSYDPKSVMLYWFPAEWTVSGIGTKANNHFSDIDKEYWSKIYQKNPPVSKNLVNLSEVFKTRRQLQSNRESVILNIGNAIGAKGINRRYLKSYNAQMVFDQIQANEQFNQSSN